MTQGLLPSSPTWGFPVMRNGDFGEVAEWCLWHQSQGKDLVGYMPNGASRRVAVADIDSFVFLYRDQIEQIERAV